MALLLAFLLAAAPVKTVDASFESRDAGEVLAFLGQFTGKRIEGGESCKGRKVTFKVKQVTLAQLREAIARALRADIDEHGEALLVHCR